MCSININIEILTSSTFHHIRHRLSICPDISIWLVFLHFLLFLALALIRFIAFFFFSTIGFEENWLNHNKAIKTRAKRIEKANNKKRIKIGKRMTQNDFFSLQTIQCPSYLLQDFFSFFFQFYLRKKRKKRANQTMEFVLCFQSADASYHYQIQIEFNTIINSFFLLDSIFISFLPLFCNCVELKLCVRFEMSFLWVLFNISNDFKRIFSFRKLKSQWWKSFPFFQLMPFN